MSRRVTHLSVQKLKVVRREMRWEQQGGFCWYCAAPVQKRKATLDHVRPLSAGGGHEIANLVMACVRCNTKKADRPVHRAWSEESNAILIARGRRLLRDAQREAAQAKRRGEAR